MLKRLSLFCAVLLITGLFSAIMPEISVAAELPGLPAPVKKQVDRLDIPVVTGQTKRSWTWGEYFASQNEPYQESPGGQRAVYYFDKGRLEINNPTLDPNNDFYATSGLLLRELVTGQTQTGDSTTESREPAEVVLAGDNPPIVPDAPTYASLHELVSFDGSWKASDLTGKVVGYTLKKGGQVDNSMQGVSQVKYVVYDAVTGHNIADVFNNFMNSSGTVYSNGKLVNAPLYNPLYVFGHPISEGYWAKVTVAGKEQMVLVQAFERRLLTYTPNNPPEFQVEMGNLGRAYYQWRTGQPGPVPAADPAPAEATETPGLQLYNQTLTAMNSVKALKRNTLQGSTLLLTEEYMAPNKLRETQSITYQGQPAKLVDIYIENRIYEGLFVNDKLVGSWYFIDVQEPFRWPTYQTLSPNDASLDYQIGAETAVNKEPARVINTKTLQLSGTAVAQSLIVSKPTGVVLQNIANLTAPSGATAVQTRNYLEYNKPIAIDEPQGAQPYTGNSVSGFQTPNKIYSETPLLSEKFAAATRPTQAEGEIVVKFADTNLTTAAVAQNYLQGFDLQSFQADKDFSILKVSPDSLSAVLDRLKADPRVEYAHPNYLYYPDSIIEPNDGGYPLQYNLKAIKAPRAWSISTGGDVIIATVDTGADASHPDLSPNIIGSFDMVDGKHPKDDPIGHGTLVSGVMTGVGNNGQAGAGVAWHSKLLIYRVGDDSLKDSDIAKGIRAATDAGARVINLSLGGAQAGETIKSAIKYAIDKGVIVVASSGNSGNDLPNYPAALPGVISVGALGKQGVPAYFSSYGSTVTITAPGVSICGTFRTNKFGCADGTSFSAPTISGVIALMLSVNPALTRDQVKAILIATATPAPGKQVGQQDPKYGYGTVNAFAAVRAVATGQFFALPADIRP